LGSGLGNKTGLGEWACNAPRSAAGLARGLEDPNGRSNRRARPGAAARGQAGMRRLTLMCELLKPRA
jgi:hypothetical protein